MRLPTLALLSFAILSLNACGTDPTERTLSGGAIGAGVGAGAAAVMGGSPWTGAAIGGAAGAITGATTRSRY